MKMWAPEIQVACSSNGVFIVQVNAAGETSGYFGRSFARGPFGELLQQLAGGGEGVLVQELDLEEISQARLQYSSIKDTNRSDLGLSESSSG